MSPVIQAPKPVPSMLNPIPEKKGDSLSSTQITNADFRSDKLIRSGIDEGNKKFLEDKKELLNSSEEKEKLSATFLNNDRGRDKLQINLEEGQQLYFGNTLCRDNQIFLKQGYKMRLGVVENGQILKEIEIINHGKDNISINILKDNTNSTGRSTDNKNTRVIDDDPQRKTQDVKHENQRPVEVKEDKKIDNTNIEPTTTVAPKEENRSNITESIATDLKYNVENKQEVVKERYNRTVRRGGGFWGYQPMTVVDTRNKVINRQEFSFNLDGKDLLINSNNCDEFKIENGKVVFSSKNPFNFQLKGKEGEVSTYKFENGQIIKVENQEEINKIQENIFIDLSSKQDFLKLNENVSVERNQEGQITKIDTGLKDEKGLDVILSRDQNGTFTYNGQACLNVSLNANGDLRFVTKNIDESGHSAYHEFELDKQGQKYVSREFNNILESNIIAASYAQFNPGNTSHITKYKNRVDDRVLKTDALTILKEARESGLVPVFHAASHGAFNHNHMTGFDSDWIKIIAEAAKEVGYDQPIIIENMHCISGVSGFEMEAMRELPVGSMVLKSQIQQTSWYNTGVAQSPSNKVNSDLVNSLVYFSDRTIENPSNIMTCAIVDNNHEPQLFSENNLYFVAGKRSTILPREYSREIQEKLDENGITKVQPNANFALRCLDKSREYVEMK